MTTTPTLTMRDIAELAGVQRPVVTMWRSRPVSHGRVIPFPAPVYVEAGIEQFSRDDIVAWLASTGRGNNEQFRYDAPALSVPTGTELETMVTLLCLTTLTGEELADTTAGQRKDLARAVDPQNKFLQQEITETTTPEILQFVDDLVEASFGPAEALQRLENGPAGRGTGARDLTTDAVKLVRTVVEACALHLDPDGVPLVHAGGSGTLLMALADGFAQLVVPGNSKEARALRRRAAVRDVDVVDKVVGPSIRLLSVVGRGPDGALEALDEVVVELGAGEVAVMLGPAALLCDEISREQERKRAQTLRSGNLVMALRLPRGLWREAHRQALGLWICAGGRAMDAPLVADLAALTLDEFDPADLAFDVAASLASAEERSARAFRYSRPHQLKLIQSVRAVVPRGTRAPRRGEQDPTKHLERIHEATLITTSPDGGFDVLAEAAPGSMLLRSRSLGELKDAQHVVVRRGSRIDPAHADPAGTVAVLSATGASDGIKLDPFDAAKFYPRAVRTEPGDIVFDEKPRPRARVDAHGGSLVASPSKILRLHRVAGIGPHAVTAIINQLPEQVDDWRTWGVPVLDGPEAERLEDALAAAAAYEAAVRRRLNAVDTLVTSMIKGVAAGAVTLKMQVKHQEGQ